MWYNKIVETEHSIPLAGEKKMRRFLQWAGRMLLVLTGRTSRLIGRTILASARYIVGLTGRTIRQIANGILQLVKDVCFGNWRRTFVTLAIVSLWLTKYFPQQTSPTVDPLWRIGFSLLGISIMLAPYRQMFGGKKKKKKK